MANASGAAMDPARLLLIGGGLSDRLGAALAVAFAAPPLVIEVASGRAAVELVKGAAYDGLIAELDALSDLAEAAEERIGRLARVAQDALVVVVAAEASISMALAAMRAGAHDCVGHDLGGAALAARLTELARRHGKGRICPATAAPSETPAPAIPVMRDLVLPMWRQEQKIIEDAIQSFAGNIALAAAALELSPSTIYRKRQAWAEMGAKRA